MVPKGKAVLLCMATALTVSAMACSSASALSDLFFEPPSKAITTTRGVVGTIGSATLQSELLGSKILIECTANTFLGEIGPEGKANGKVEYKSCSMFSIREGIKTNLGPECKVTEPITFSVQIQLITQTKAGVVAGELKPASGAVLVELKIGGSFCLFTGGATLTFKVEGTYLGSGGAQAEEALTEHEIVATGLGTSITFEGKPAVYFQDSLRLKQSNGKVWYVD